MPTFKRWIWRFALIIWTSILRTVGSKMSTLIPFLVLDQTCDQVQNSVNQLLAGAGFRVVRTFDLQVARLAHPDCPCPHHGTNECNCQMVVLLVYSKQEYPATLVIHGQDG